MICSTGKLYQSNAAESFGDSVIKWIKVGLSLSCWTSPMLLTFLYRKDMFTVEGLQVLTSYLSGLGVIVVLAVIVRAFGRCLNNDYTAFIHVLGSAHSSPTPQNRRHLAQYDFDMSAWPVDFTSNYAVRQPREPISLQPFRNQSFIGRLKDLPLQLLAYISVNTFGRRMVYPGTTAFIQTLIAPALIQGRAKLIEENCGIRAKLRSEDGNDIDTMFVDRRNSFSQTAANLVICCEGNSGFYEVGCMCTPLEAGYSVLGWNHPGFWGSTGVPFPSQEQNAIDVVMQYAIHRLGFSPERIIIFAWSIGGYSASWAAMNYPEISHVILDATFDDLLQLAYTKLPSSWGSLAQIAVRKYLNLNIAEQLCRYPGPVLLIRRTKDEIITTVDPTVISSNRGNDLAIKLLEHRYPSIVNESTLAYLWKWLSTDQVGQALLKVQYNVDDDIYVNALAGYDPKEESYPSELGEDMSTEQKIKLALFLISKYMEDFNSTHCTPLPRIHFKRPWKDFISERRTQGFRARQGSEK